MNDLSALVTTQLKAVCDQVHALRRMREQADVGAKTIARNGIQILLTGGIGKTLAAQWLAHELRLELYRVDLSAVVSKYIGETEKNLDRVFDAALAHTAILFLDEAEALFGKRSQVADAHDRYANQEVSYLLQRMEDFNGIVILATNIREKIDDSFLRRFRFAIECPERVNKNL